MLIRVTRGSQSSTILTDARLFRPTMSEPANESISVFRRAADRVKWFGRGVSKVVWDNDDKPEEERRFVRKLDCLLMTIVSSATLRRTCLSPRADSRRVWATLSSTSRRPTSGSSDTMGAQRRPDISNAYASGMKEALDFKGDQYNVLLTMFTAGEFDHVRTLCFVAYTRLCHRPIPGNPPHRPHIALYLVAHL